MDRRLIDQLVELAGSFNKIGLKPVICGGLGIYLCFHKTQRQEKPDDSSDSRYRFDADKDTDTRISPAAGHC
jgi:hypothetical protein